MYLNILLRSTDPCDRLSRNKYTKSNFDTSFKNCHYRSNENLFRIGLVFLKSSI